MQAKTRAAIHNLVEQIRVFIYSKGMARLAVARFKFYDNCDRLFDVRVERYEEPVSRSDNLRCEGYTTPRL